MNCSTIVSYKIEFVITKLRGVWRKQWNSEDLKRKETKSDFSIFLTNWKLVDDQNNLTTTLIDTVYSRWFHRVSQWDDIHNQFFHFLPLWMFLLCFIKPLLNWKDLLQISQGNSIPPTWVSLWIFRYALSLKVFPQKEHLLEHVLSSKWKIISFLPWKNLRHVLHLYPSLYFTSSNIARLL